MRTGYMLTVGAMTLCLLSPGARSDSWVVVTESEKLLPTDTSHNARAGTSVDIFGDYIAAGAPEASGHDDGGIVYVWDRTSGSWALVAEIDPASVADGSEFGAALEFTTFETLVIGAPGFGEAGPTYNMGTGFLYAGDWSQNQEIPPAAASSGDQWGTDVSMYGYNVAIGSPLASFTGAESGAVSIFNYNSSIWLENQTVLPTDLASSSRFGSQVAMGEHWLAVGDYAALSTAGSGRVHLFHQDSEWDTFIEMQVLEDPTTGNGNSRFGEAIAMEGSLLAVSAPWGSIDDYVYVYELDGGTWGLLATLSDPNGDSASGFGASIAIEGDRIVVGANGADIGASNDGAAWVFEARGDNWVATHLLTMTSPGSSDFLGASIGFDGNTVVAGAYNDDDVATNSGAVYVYDLPISDCNGNGIDDVTDLADGTSVDCNANSVPDECESDCNGNGIADECDLADETSSDCNGNGIPDSCDDDCNGNGIPDDCDIHDEPRRDYDVNGTLDECEGIACWNYTWGTSYASIAEALEFVDDDLNSGSIGVFQYALDGEPGIDFTGTQVDFTAWEGLDFPVGGSVVLGDGVLMSQAEGEDQSLYFDGDVEVPLGVHTRLLSSDMGFTATGSVTIRPGAILEMGDGDIDFDGNTSLLGGTISHTEYLSFSGVFNGFGILDSQDVVQSGTMNVQADLEVIGMLYNSTSGVINVQNGVLTVLGGLTNTGTITGDVSGRGGERDTDGLAVFGDLACGDSSAMKLPAGLRLSVEGHVDIAATDAQLFNLADTELRCIGTGALQSVEVMSRDRGAVMDGFGAGEVGNFPLSVFRVGPATANVSLIDTHVNDAGARAAEAMYVESLVVDAGTTLQTNGLKIYCIEAVIDETAVVSDLDDIVIIDDSCQGDINGDLAVDVIDLLSVIAEWGPCKVPGGCDADIDDSGAIDILDLLAVIGAWGSCS
ncbi:MAG: hypothetical protein P8K80_08325 [Phycisphaerales bacterium]|nr:hypothetical protein [Phycisphaerales bacterium]